MLTVIMHTTKLPNHQLDIVRDRSVGIDIDRYGTVEILAAINSCVICSRRVYDGGV